jgi:hypothetical protein
VHLATVSRQSSLRTEHGVICPDCKQEVAHTCYLSSPLSLQTPLRRHERQLASTLTNPVGLRSLVTDPTAQGNLFSSHVTSTNSTSPSLTSHMRSLPPSNSDISSLFAFHSANHPYPLTSLPRLTISSSSKSVSSYPLCPLGPTTSMHSLYNSPKDNFGWGRGIRIRQISIASHTGRGRDRIFQWRYKVQISKANSAPPLAYAFRR